MSAFLVAAVVRLVVVSDLLVAAVVRLVVVSALLVAAVRVRVLVESDLAVLVTAVVGLVVVVPLVVASTSDEVGSSEVFAVTSEGHGTEESEDGEEDECSEVHG